MTNTFNSANQLTGNGTDSFEYDTNGNLWKTNSVVSHTWDRANRLLSHGGLDYAYDGLGNRISQDNGTDVTSYLLDLQASLPRVLSETVGANVTRFVHSPRGLHATQNPADAWFYSLQDGLGSQRAEIGANVAVVGSQDFTPYGVVQNVTGTFNSPHAFTGEPVDANGLQYHRARYYDPAMGVWASLDPFEGIMDIPMSLNGYGYVHENPTNWIDSTGLCCENAVCDELAKTGNWATWASVGCDKQVTQDTSLDIYSSPLIPPWNKYPDKLPSDFVNEAKRICDVLCPKFLDGGTGQFKSGCRHLPSQICERLCNLQEMKSEDDFLHKGLLVRWGEYFVNPQNLTEESGRRGTHREAYEKVQSGTAKYGDKNMKDLAREWRTNLCGDGNKVPAEVKEFDKAIGKWEEQLLQAVVPDSQSVQQPWCPLCDIDLSWITGLYVAAGISFAGAYFIGGGGSLKLHSVD